MTAQLAPAPIFKAFDNNGFPLAFGRLSTYAAGTMTPQATYVDSTQTTQNTNPVQLNFRGECNLWLDPTKSYKFLLEDLLGNTIPGWPIDNITIGNANPTYNIVPGANNLYTLGTPSFAWANVYVGPNGAPIFDTASGNVGFYAQIAAETAVSATPTDFFYPPGNVHRYGAIGDGVTNDTAALTTALSVAIGSGGLGGLGYIYLPRGIYLSDPQTITIGNTNANPANGTNIHIFGDGMDATIIKQRLSPSNPLLKFVSSNPTTTLATCAILIENLQLLGSGNLIHGVSFNATPGWEIRACNISGFNRGVDIQSGLFGVISARTDIFSNLTGVYFTSAGGAGVTNPSPANVISVRDSRIQANAVYGCDLVNGSDIVFDTTDFEGNGTAASFTSNPGNGATSATLTANWPLASGAYSCIFPDGEVRSITFTNGATTATWTGGLANAQSAAWIVTPTGAIALRATLPTGFGISTVTFDKCWFEANHGQCVFGENVTGLMLSFKDTLVLGNDHGQDLNIAGAQHILIDQCPMVSAGGSISTIGVSGTSQVTFFTARNSYFGTLNDNAVVPIYENVNANGAQSAWGRHTQQTLTFTGCSTAPTITADVYQQAQDVEMNFFTQVTATSSATTFTLTGLAAALRPAFIRGDVINVIDNGADVPVYAQLNPSGVLTFVHTFNAAGIKGVDPAQFRYRLGA